MLPEAEPVAIGDPFDSDARKQELAEILDPPANGGEPMNRQPIFLRSTDPKSLQKVK